MRRCCLMHLSVPKVGCFPPFFRWQVRKMKGEWAGGADHIHAMTKVIHVLQLPL
jgi:hypothetical protein